MATLSQDRKKSTLISKLRLACNDLPALLKNGHREDYNYLRVADLAEAVNEFFSKHGLLLIPNDLEFRESACGGGDVFVKTEFILTDGKVSQSFVSFGSGRSAEGHALHIAQTVALKSWLKRLTLIFGEEDDAETEGQEAVPYQRGCWESALKKSGKNIAQIKTYMKAEFNAEYSRSQDIMALTASEFNQALKWLLQSPTAKKPTVASGASGKPQSVVSVLDRAEIDDNFNQEAV